MSAVPTGLRGDFVISFPTLKRGASKVRASGARGGLAPRPLPRSTHSSVGSSIRSSASDSGSYATCAVSCIKTGGSSALGPQLAGTAISSMRR